VVRIKICGVRREEDISLLNSLRVDYAGLVLYPGSPRYVPPEVRKKLLRLRKTLLCVAVMVNPTVEEAKAVLEEGFDLIQLHGEEGFEIAEKIGPHRVIKAFRVKGEIPRIDERWREVHAILLDTYSEKAYGGTGESFDWRIARELVDRDFRVILSGGLKPENVARAISEVRPFGVDVSSGVEARKGVKDPQKIREFVQSVRNSSL